MRRQCVLHRSLSGASALYLACETGDVVWLRPRGDQGKHTFALDNLLVLLVFCPSVFVCLFVCLSLLSSTSSFSLTHIHSSGSPSSNSHPPPSPSPPRSLLKSQSSLQQPAPILHIRPHPVLAPLPMLDVHPPSRPSKVPLRKAFLSGWSALSRPWKTSTPRTQT